ncbi:MAG: hypothetical protein QW166_00405 [Candidatus Bathyarchaeia archaeon]
MFEINQLLKQVTEVMQMQKTEAEELHKFEEKMEAVINSAKPNSMEQLIAEAYLVSAKQMRIYNDAIISIYGSLWTLLSEQEKGDKHSERSHNFINIPRRVVPKSRKKCDKKVKERLRRYSRFY